MAISRLACAAAALLAAAYAEEPAAAVRATAPAASAPKVILFVLVDDLGWGDVGFHGSTEIPTPTMDSLVAEGIELNRHYVYKMCTPSRSAFFSGRLPVHVQTRLDNPEVQDAGVPRNMTAIGKVMKSAGYHTAVVGKWDIGEWGRRMPAVGATAPGLCGLTARPLTLTARPLTRRPHRNRATCRHGHARPHARGPWL